LDHSAETEFSEFAHGRWPGLARLGYGLTGDRGLAEDLAQTALASAYASWSRVRRADDPDAYVRRILVNAYRASFRRRRVSEQLSGLPHEYARAIATDPGVNQPSERDAIVSALLDLPPRQREVVVLRYWLDLTEAQVAAALNCSVGNVKSQASRALAKLRSSTELAEWGAQ
jgi:RNA polymerase sigma-70 factor (sigma-E family)